MTSHHRPIDLGKTAISLADNPAVDRHVSPPVPPDVRDALRRTRGGVGTLAQVRRRRKDMIQMAVSIDRSRPGS